MQCTSMEKRSRILCQIILQKQESNIQELNVYFVGLYYKNKKATSKN